ncbi:putative non-specific serine/threonine protein kinase [Rosa chinensis]|uniref:Putative non-specific serine/threonine protein kinase n=1 Tax=Rosa chinensis TaxID=74649 RepID=A0A2P6Q0N2_ROSCH|nr:putative non-specific serine/threonine protein kinase [Rosa chinensis]
MANRDQPVNGHHSKLSLPRNGNLILTDAGKSIFWSSNTVSNSLVQLLLHDTGNLVLLASDSVVLWESFASPTNTLLPYQPLTRNTKSSYLLEASPTPPPASTSSFSIMTTPSSFSTMDPKFRVFTSLTLGF